MRLSSKLLVTLLAIASGLALVIYFLHSRSKAGPDSATQVGPNVLWRAAVGSQRLTAPALGLDGTIYAGSEDGLYAVSAAGKILWKHPVREGILAPPVVATDGVIYFSTAFGDVQSVNADGTARWGPRYGSIGYLSPPALGNDGVVYLANNVSDLYALRPDRTDSKLWTIQTEREGIGFAGVTLPGTARVGQAPSNAPPAIGVDGNLYVPRQHWLHSITPDGRERWTTFLTNGLLGPAAIGQDGTIYVGSAKWERGIYAVNSNGTLRWNSDVRGIVRGSPVVDNQGNIYFSLDTEVAALAPDGRVKWEIMQPGIFTPVLTQDGTLYAGLVFDAVPYLAAIDTNGSIKWKWKLPNNSSEPVIGADGTVYFTASNQVVALQAGGSSIMSSPWARYQHDSQHTGRMQ
jgi:outer membrane protein assembly factor BamB